MNRDNDLYMLNKEDPCFMIIVNNDFTPACVGDLVMILYGYCYQNNAYTNFYMYDFGLIFNIEDVSLDYEVIRSDGHILTMDPSTFVLHSTFKDNENFVNNELSTASSYADIIIARCKE